jgi:hypothetical protein
MPDQFGNPLPGDLNLSQTNFGSMQDSTQSSFNPMAMFQSQQPQTPSAGGFMGYQPQQQQQPMFTPDAGIEQGMQDIQQGQGVNQPQQEGGFFNNAQGGAGYGVQAIGAATGLANAFMGFQQVGVAKDQLAFQKNAWQEQFDIQKGEYDRRVSERSARTANNQKSTQAAKQAASI